MHNARLKAQDVLTSEIRSLRQTVRSIATHPSLEGGDAETERVAAVLIESLTDGDEWIRRYAALGLARLGPRVPRALPALASASVDQDKSVRLFAVMALDRFCPEDPRADLPLLVALQDEVSLIRRIAADAVERLPRR